MDGWAEAVLLFFFPYFFSWWNVFTHFFCPAKDWWAPAQQPKWYKLEVLWVGFPPSFFLAFLLYYESDKWGQIRNAEGERCKTEGGGGCRCSYCQNVKYRRLSRSPFKTGGHPTALVSNLCILKLHRAVKAFTLCIGLSGILHKELLDICMASIWSPARGTAKKLPPRSLLRCYLIHISTARGVRGAGILLRRMFLSRNDVNRRWCWHLSAGRRTRLRNSVL